MTEPLDLDAIRARWSEPVGGPWPSDVWRVQQDVAELVAEVERLREEITQAYDAHARACGARDAARLQRDALIAEVERLRAAHVETVSKCPRCGGSGTCYMFEEAGEDCIGCDKARRALRGEV